MICYLSPIMNDMNECTLQFKIITKMQNQNNSATNETDFPINKTNVIKGSLIGVAISAFMRWNSGRYSRIGEAIRRALFVRKFILTKPKPALNFFTNYYMPDLSSVMNNFVCFSGEPGIGKSSHFQNMAYVSSGIRPAIYVAFKASGKDATFEEDIASQTEYGSDCPGILSEIIKAVRSIDQINKNPIKLWAKVLVSHALFALGLFSVFMAPIEATYGMAIFMTGAIGYCCYLQFILPFIVQSLRRTVPLVIFDDLNKIEHLNMFSQVVRYLQLIDNNMANVVLVSSDEETWVKLRKQPGVKDRLRLRQIKYDPAFTAHKILELTEHEKDFNFFMKHVSGSEHYSQDFVRSLAREIIGRRQVNLRRFISILKLHDEEEYEKLVEVLIKSRNGTLSTSEAVQKFTDILYDSEMETMVSNLKNIKRQMMQMTEEQFFVQLRTLLLKARLPSDNAIAPHLKNYNIVRDLRSQYVFNGKFMQVLFTMALREYEKDMREFRNIGSGRKGHGIFSEDERVEGELMEKVGNDGSSHDL